MFQRLGSLVARHPWRFIIVWVVAGLALASLASARGSSVTTDDPATFLPKGSDSAKATRLGQEAFGRVKGASSVTAMVARADGGRLDAADVRAIDARAAALRRGRVAAVEPAGVGPGGRFSLVAIQFRGNSADSAVQRDFRAFRADARSDFSGGSLRVGFTGGVASAADNADADRSRQGLQGILLLGAIVLLLLVFFRGILAAIVPVVAVLLVAGAAGGVVVAGALAFGAKLDASTPELIRTVLIGIGIDYALFMIFRYRERLRAGDVPRLAAATSTARVGRVVLSAGLVIGAAFATLGLAQFGQFRTLGPAIAASVVVMALAGVTLMPALLAVTGRRLFWPSRSLERPERQDGVAARLGAAVARRPGRIALATLAALVALAAGAYGVTMSYDLGGDAPSTEAARVTDAISAALPRGAVDPQRVYVRADHPMTAADLRPLEGRLAAVDGVGLVRPAVLSADRRAAEVDVELTMESTTRRALDIARGPLREAARAGAPAGAAALVGGTAAVYADVSDSIDHDLRLTFPVAAVLILLILMVTLRSLLAPLALLGAAALEFAATLGATALVFQHGLGEAGVAFTMPLVLFLFVVALGSDYNIVTAARLREESDAGRSPRGASAAAVRRVAPTVAAAGLVLAASFSTLMLARDEGTRQLGFAMAAGILIASLVVSTLLVPALATLTGRAAWWPGRRRGRVAGTGLRRPEPAPARR
jgi:putative drug exporter of the RND superfamily